VSDWAHLEEKFVRMTLHLHPVLFVILIIGSSGAFPRSPSDVEIASLIDAEVLIDKDVEIVSSSCKEEDYGFTYRVKYIYRGVEKEIRSLNFEEGKRTCDESFLGYFQPTMLLTLYLGREPGWLYPVANVDKYIKRSFGVKLNGRVLFLGDYLFPPGNEAYLVSVENLDFHEMFETADLRCTFSRFKVFFVKSEFSFGTCSSEFFQALRVFGVSSSYLLIGKPRQLPSGF